MNIKGKTALVTGANRGLGFELVRALLNAGIGRVYAGGRHEQLLARTVALDPSRVDPVIIDVTVPTQVDGVSQLADLDLLINNAGLLIPGGALDVGDKTAEQTFAVNLYGPWQLTRALLPVLEARGGTVVNVLSLLALTNASFAAAYCAYKHALHALTQSLREELAGRGVAVLSAYPGGIDTDMLAGFAATKTPPRIVAQAIVEGIGDTKPFIFPDPVSRRFGSSWQPPSHP